ncbi:YitT family protein [Peribacillus frigoritolerans]|uniref:YitT family protein n=1 Tax=Peribacillus frigoritolerans TaxID=450367 RepID=UPI0010594535|nr:YitT family protein [Peribacillus frigoritolerans]TDL83434.1 YitT family protein [Peribacillus frigoritolerans]
MKKFVEYVFLTLGASIVAIGLETMLAPNGLVDGGVTALSIMANALWGIPIYVVFLGLNIPILIFTAKEVGKTFVIRTLYANIITTVGLVLFKSIPPITQSEVLIVLYGGVILGVGIGIVVKFGGAIDGTEMLAIWFNQHYRFPIASFLLSVNAFIFTIAAFIYSLEQAMLSLAVFYIVTKMINYVLDGLNRGKSVMIISEKPDEVGDSIINYLNISITFLYGEGGFLGEKKKVIYCITNRFIFSKLKSVVLSADPSAIMEASYVCETSGIDRSLIFPKANPSNNKS